MVKKLFGVLALTVSLSMFAYSSEIPFTIEKGFVIISGKAGNEPIQAALFTGSTFSFFNHDLIRRLKVDLSSTNDLQVGVSKENALTFANIPGVTFADQRPAEVKMRQKSFDAIEKVLGHKLDAIIGLDYLNERIVQLDFKKRVIRFLDKPPFDYESTDRLTDPSNKIQVAMRMDEHLRTIFGDPVSMPITNEIKLNGFSVRALFDTGVAYPVTIAPFAAKKDSIGAVPAKESFSKVQLKSIDLDGYDMTDVPALINSAWDDTETRYAAVIGIGIMQNFTVTFDWKNKWIALER